MPSTDRKLELKAKTLVAQTASQAAVYAKGLICFSLSNEKLTVAQLVVLNCMIQSQKVFHLLDVSSPLVPILSYITSNLQPLVLFI
jgi:hypothetical protein